MLIYQQLYFLRYWENQWLLRWVVCVDIKHDLTVICLNDTILPMSIIKITYFLWWIFITHLSYPTNHFSNSMCITNILSTFVWFFFLSSSAIWSTVNFFCHSLLHSPLVIFFSNSVFCFFFQRKNGNFDHRNQWSLDTYLANSLKTFNHK